MSFERERERERERLKKEKRERNQSIFGLLLRVSRRNRISSEIRYLLNRYTPPWLFLYSLLGETMNFIIRTVQNTGRRKSKRKKKNKKKKKKNYFICGDGCLSLIHRVAKPHRWRRKKNTKPNPFHGLSAKSRWWDKKGTDKDPPTHLLHLHIFSISIPKLEIVWDALL